MSDVSDWWTTAIIDMEPGRIALRGHEIQDLIGSVSFPQMIWLMLRGGLPSQDQAALLESALVAAVDHGRAGAGDACTVRRQVKERQPVVSARQNQQVIGQSAIHHKGLVS